MSIEPFIKVRRERHSREWLVFYTKPRSEFRCEKHLKRMDIDVLVPKKEVLRRWSDRTKRVLFPLFPGYLFAFCDPRERLDVLAQNGIVRSIWHDGRPAKLSANDQYVLKLTEQHRNSVDVVDFPLPALDSRVKVVEGPFAGVEGVVVKHQGKHFVCVDIEAIGSSLTLNIDKGSLQSV